MYVPKENTHTICFSNRTYHEPTNILSENIRTYEGGGTNILAGLMKMEEKIA